MELLIVIAAAAFKYLSSLCYCNNFIQSTQKLWYNGMSEAVERLKGADLKMNRQPERLSGRK